MIVVEFLCAPLCPLWLGFMIRLSVKIRGRFSSILHNIYTAYLPFALANAQPKRQSQYYESRRGSLSQV